MSISEDLWSIIVQYSVNPIQRLSILTLNKEIYKKTYNAPIYFLVCLDGNKLTKNSTLVKRVILKNWHISLWNQVDSSGLLELICLDSNLTMLPELPMCKVINVSNNKLSYLPDLPSCVDLDCSMNYIEEMPNMPKIEYLNCSYNLLTRLESLNCTELDCSNNYLSEICDMPNLVHMKCNNNMETNDVLSDEEYDSQ